MFESKKIPRIIQYFTIQEKERKAIDTVAERMECNSTFHQIKVEHIISKIKKLKINTETFENKLYRYNMISDVACGIVNFKIQWK